VGHKIIPTTIKMPKLTADEIQKLIETARKVRENAMAFKSKKMVGVAVLTKKGNCYGGCNIDALMSGQGSCAEVNAVNAAVAQGEHVIRAICDYSDELIYPCGSCLQYLSQFAQVAGFDPEIILVSETGEQKSETLERLLPERYISSSFAEALRNYSR
jgi:cytidine deaminase